MKRWWLDARALALPIAAYWFVTIASLSTFTVAIIVCEGLGKHDNAAALAGCWLSTVIAVAIGQLFAILRLRTPIVLSMSLVVWVVSMITAVGAAAIHTGGGGPVLTVAFFIVLFPFFLPCGLWSLQTHMAMGSTFLPIVWIVGTILEVTEKTGAVNRWFAGDKYAIWGIVTAPVLGIGIGLVLAYLAAREMHRLHRWRFGAGGPDLPEKDVGVPLPGCGGVAALLALALVVTVSAGLVAPYLWRTGPGRDGNDGGGGTEQTQAQESNDGNPIEEAMRKAAQHAAASLFSLLLMLFLVIAGIVVFGPPLRRMLLLQHLRRPLWPVTPTERVRQHWRLVEIALGDIGIFRLPGDSARGLVRRAVGEIVLVDVDALSRCADVADRVAFGLGLHAEDTMLARRTAEMTYQAVWDELSERQKLFAMYRFL